MMIKKSPTKTDSSRSYFSDGAKSIDRLSGQSDSTEQSNFQFYGKAWRKINVSK